MPTPTVDEIFESMEIVRSITKFSPSEVHMTRKSFVDLAVREFGKSFRDAKRIAETFPHFYVGKVKWLKIEMERD